MATENVTATRQAASPYLSMLGGSISFALMGTLTHALRFTCDWPVIAFARTFLALVFALGLVFVARVPLVFWRPRTLWVRSIAGSVSLVCTFFALTHLPVSEVLTLTNMFPVWVALLSWPLLKEPPTGQVWLSVGSGVAGVVLIQQPHFAEGNFAALLALAGSVSTAIAMLGLHRLQQIDIRAIVVHFSLVGMLFCVAAYFLFGQTSAPREAPTADALWMLLGVGVTATVGQLLLTVAFTFGSPAKVSVVGLSQIVFAMALDVIFWNRSFNAVTLAGMALVVAPTGWLMVSSKAAVDEPSPV
jgi:drug/metabolite transporter (DMT)-like permease